MKHSQKRPVVSRKTIIILVIVAVMLVVVVAALALRRQSTSGNSRKTGPSSSHQKQSQTSPSTPTPAPQATTSHGWHMTVYYTAVEQYHHGQPEQVKGCPSSDCANGDTDLGSYPADFVEKIKNEGAGRITSGANAGRYLNWAYDTGYWLDTIPSDTNGHPLQPFASAAADSDTLAQNTSFKLADCGLDKTAITQSVCDKLQSATWKIVDHFTPGLGGPKHVDLYVGEENQENFEASDQYVDLTNVSLQL